MSRRRRRSRSSTLTLKPAPSSSPISSAVPNWGCDGPQRPCAMCSETLRTSGAALEALLRAVPVVDVPVDHRDPLDARGPRPFRDEGLVREEAVAVGLRRLGVVAGRANERIGDPGALVAAPRLRRRGRCRQRRAAPPTSRGRRTVVFVKRPPPRSHGFAERADVRRARGRPRAPRRSRAVRRATSGAARGGLARAPSACSGVARRSPDAARARQGGRPPPCRTDRLACRGRGPARRRRRRSRPRCSVQAGLRAIALPYAMCPKNSPASERRRASAFKASAVSAPIRPELLRMSAPRSTRASM